MNEGGSGLTQTLSFSSRCGHEKMELLYGPFVATLQSLPSRKVAICPISMHKSKTASDVITPTVEQRCVTKFLAKEKHAAILRMLHAQYGEQTEICKCLRLVHKSFLMTARKNQTCHTLTFRQRLNMTWTFSHIEELILGDTQIRLRDIISKSGISVGWNNYTWTLTLQGSVCLAGPKDVNIQTEGTEDEINVLMYRKNILKMSEFGNCGIYIFLLKKSLGQPWTTLIPTVRCEKINYLTILCWQVEKYEWHVSLIEMSMTNEATISGSQLCRLQKTTKSSLIIITQIRFVMSTSQTQAQSFSSAVQKYKWWSFHLPG